jgi:hypothetical protein
MSDKLQPEERQGPDPLSVASSLWTVEERLSMVSEAAIKFMGERNVARDECQRLRQERDEARALAREMWDRYWYRPWWFLRVMWAPWTLYWKHRYPWLEESEE